MYIAFSDKPPCDQCAVLPATHLKNSEEAHVNLPDTPQLYQFIVGTQEDWKNDEDNDPRIYNDGDTLLRTDTLRTASECTLCKQSTKPTLSIKYVADVVTPHRKEFTVQYCFECTDKLQLALDDFINKHEARIPDEAF